MTGAHRALPRLILVTDRHATGGRDLVDVVRAALAGGLAAVQLREKDLSGRALYALAERLRVVTADADALLFVNDRVDVAIGVDADGVHLGEGSMPVAAVRALVGPSRRIGVSTHAPGALHAAGADFVFFGPVRGTPSKAAFGPPQGLDHLARAVAASRVPVLAIGGLTSADAPAVRATGAHGLAVIRAILAATDPDVAAADLLHRLG